MCVFCVYLLKNVIFFGCVSDISFPAEGRKIELVAGKGREELLLQFLFAFFNNRKPWDKVFSFEKKKIEHTLKNKVKYF